MDSDHQSSGPSLTREQLLSALDAQIKFVSEGQRNEGWTRWAIWGALAAIVWHATELVTRPEFALSRAVLAGFGVFVIWALLECILGIISPASRIDVGPTRFRMVTDVVSALRPELTASGLRHLLIVIALVCFHYPGQWPLWTYSGLALILNVLVFVYSMTSIALPTKLNMRATLSILPFLQMAWLVAAGITVTSLIQKDFHSFTLTDVRFALVLNAGSYLLIRLATATSSGHLLNELNEIRQHAALDRLAVPEAIGQTEKLLTGLNLADVLNPLVNATLKEAQNLDQMLTHSSGLLGQIRGQLSALRENPPTQAKGSTMFADTLRLLDELQTEEQRISARLKRLTRDRNSFLLRALVIAAYCRESRPGIREPAKKVQDAFTRANQSVTDFRQQHLSLRMEVNQFIKSHAPEFEIGS